MAHRTPTDALMAQMAVLGAVQDMMSEAIDDLTGSTNPDDATWADVARFAYLVDRAKRVLNVDG